MYCPACWMFRENITRIIYQRLGNIEYQINNPFLIERPLNLNCTADLCLF